MRSSARCSTAEAGSRPQCALECLGQQVLRQDAVPGAIGEEPVQGLGVLGVELLELGVAHVLYIGSQESSSMRLSGA